MGETGNPWPVPITHQGEGMNMAQWVGIYEDWAQKMMGMGYKVDDLPGIVAQAGEIFPKNLIASIHAKDQLFPGADMLYEYDMTGHQKRRPYDSHDWSKGMMPWEAMDPSEIGAANSYHSWANDPNNAGYESAFGDHNYNAWLAAQHGSQARSGIGGFGGTYSGPFQWQPPSAHQALQSQGINGDTLGNIMQANGLGGSPSPTTPGMSTYGEDAFATGVMPGTDEWRKRRGEAV